MIAVESNFAESVSKVLLVEARTGILIASESQLIPNILRIVVSPEIEGVTSVVHS